MKKIMYGLFFLIIIGICASVEIFSKSLIGNHINIATISDRQAGDSRTSLQTNKWNFDLNSYENIDEKFDAVLDKVKEEYKNSYINEISIIPQRGDYFFEIHLIESGIEYELSIMSDSNELVLEEMDTEDLYDLDSNQNFLPREMVKLSEILREAGAYLSDLTIEEIEMERTKDTLLWIIHTTNDWELVFNGTTGDFVSKQMDD
ncbi:hypothetical protein NGF69_16315 [Enterococcus casseliflavus]|nr:hypothetical protein [Enterococcus casseliflavus]